MNVLKRIVIICKKQYEEYVSSIRNAYDSVEAFGFEIDEALASIPGINPGAVVFLNYYSREDFQSGLALEHLMKIRSATGSQVLILSSSKPPVDFIMQASDYGAKAQWGKEIDFDIDNIPETELPSPALPYPTLLKNINNLSSWKIRFKKAISIIGYLKIGKVS